MHEIPSETEESKQEQYYFSVGSNIIGGVTISSFPLPCLLLTQTKLVNSRVYFGFRVNEFCRSYCTSLQTQTDCKWNMVMERKQNSVPRMLVYTGLCVLCTVSSKYFFKQ